MQGHCEEALDQITRGAERARAMSSDRGQAEIQLARSLVSFSQGNMPATFEAAQLAVEVAERSGEWLDVYIAYLLRGWAASRLGRHDEASASLVRAEEITQTRLGGMVFMADWIAAAWAELSLNAGDAEQAAERARGAVRIAEANQSLFGAGFAYRTWGTALSPHRFEEAGRHFAESVRAFENGEARLEAARTELAWGLACKSNGDLKGMREHTEKARVTLNP
jgi:tetratricopeptide (TPR) repeat protein